MQAGIAAFFGARLDRYEIIAVVAMDEIEPIAVCYAIEKRRRSLDVLVYSSQS
ncbi:MAG: hypothetical protein LBP89_04750 [Helicobacteraceae bacterium]|nr:hypothetical protein [Helicobacteraceae bacterium]